MEGPIADPVRTSDDLGRSRQARKLAIAALVLAGAALVCLIAAVVVLSTNGRITRPDWPTKSLWWWAGYLTGMLSVAFAVAARVTHRRSGREAGPLVRAATVAGLVVVTIWVASTAFLVLTARSGLLEAIPGRPRRRRARGVRCSAEAVADTPISPAICADEVPAPTEAERELLASSWSRAAMHENEAVSSFLQLEAELDELGAPDDLVAGARRAARQEIGHTAVCRRLARQHGATGLDVAPVPFCRPVGPPRSSISRRYRVVRLAVESYVDGCANEGSEAARLQYASTRAARPLGATLARIADEEHEHAALAWATVEWAVAEGGPLLRRCLALLPTDRSSAATPVPPGLRPEVLAAHGWVAGDGVAQAVAAVRADARARVSHPG